MAIFAVAIKNSEGFDLGFSGHEVRILIDLADLRGKETSLGSRSKLEVVNLVKLPPGRAALIAPVHFGRMNAAVVVVDLTGVVGEDVGEAEGDPLFRVVLIGLDGSDTHFEWRVK